MTIVTSRPQPTGYAENIFGSVLNRPNGFINRTDSTITFDEGTREFTLTPNGTAEIWVRGTVTTLTDPITITLSDTFGIHHIYFDGLSTPPQLEEQIDPQGFTPDLLRTKAYVASVHWNPDHQVAATILDTRHSTIMDGDTLYYFNQTVGSVIISGLNLANFQTDQSGDVDAHAQFSVQNGLFRNKDLSEDVVDGSPQTLSPAAQIPIAYREGPNGHWNIKPATNFPLIESGTAGFTGTDGRAAWNENTSGTNWQLTTADDNNIFAVHYFVIPSINNKVIGVLGQQSYGNIQDAVPGIPDELVQLNPPFYNFIPIGTVLFNTRTGYSNTPQTRIISLIDGSDYFDWKESTNLSVAISGSGVSDHGLLSGLSDDDHPQYLTETRGDARYYTQTQVDSLIDQLSITTISTNTTLDNTADVWLVDGNTTATLPLASNFPNRRFQIKRIGTDQITIDVSGSDMIDGDTNIVVDTQYTSITVVSDGTSNWYII